MEIFKELEKVLTNDMSKISNIEVYYPGENIISGFIARIIPIPFSAIVCLSESPSGVRNPDHEIDFKSAKKIILKYHNGEIITYN